MGRRATVLGDVDAIAERVVELLDRPPRRLLKADEVARLLAVDVAFVYAHQRELGALRCHAGGRGFESPVAPVPEASR